MLKKKVILLIVLLLTGIGIIPILFPNNTQAAINWGTVVRQKGVFTGLQFTVSSPGTAQVFFRTEQLIIIPFGAPIATFSTQDLRDKGFYSPGAGSQTISFSAEEIAQKSGVTVQEIRRVADTAGFNLAAVLGIYNGSNRIAEITRAEDVDVVCGPNNPTCGYTFPLSSRDDMRSRWGVAFDPQKPIERTLTIQIEGQGSTTPAGSKAPGTVHKNMSGSVSLSATPADGWKFAQWVDVTGGIVQFSTNPNSSVYMDKDKTIRAVFIPNNTAPPGGKKEYLTVVPCTYTLFEGEYKRFSAFHHKADGSSQEVTNSSEWSVSNSNIAKLSATTKGELWGLKKGFVVLKAQYKGMEATADVTVIPEPVPPPPNYEPRADFSISNPSPVEGEKVGLFDNSTHDGSRYGEEIVRWDWNIEKIGSSTDKNTTATWNEVGTYKITLRVEDQDGDSDSCTKSVVVGPALPAAVITVSADHIIVGREIHIDGDESTAAMGRDIKWDEMEWKFYNPNNALAYEYTGRYPLGKGTSEEKDLTNSVLNKTGNWKITLKVKDTNDNESEITERIIYIHPDNPPVADFWLASEAIRYSYQGYDLTVRDLSTAGTPDASLGDEIYERTWTLYYDANNDGNAQGSGDEVIRPGDKDKAAEIIQASINDSRPVIRFNKTGRYQLELAVKEHYEAWGEINEGLSDNTDNKTLADKNIMVINLAPTVAFDIKKKTPVDVLFAVDYSVSDTKYGSLESGQAGFVNDLESGFLEPEVGVKRVNSGEVGQLWSIQVGGQNYSVTKHLIGDWYRLSNNFYPGYIYQNDIAINIATGEIRPNFEILTALNDGTYIKGVYKYDLEIGLGYTGSLIGGERIDGNLNILTPFSVYDNAIKAALPPNKTEYDWEYGRNATTSYKLEQIIFLPNKNIFLWVKGERVIEGSSTPSHYTHHLIKLNSNLVKAYTYDIGEIICNSYVTENFTLSHIFADSNQIVFLKNTHTNATLEETSSFISVGDQGIKNLGTWKNRYGALGNPSPKFSSTGSGKYFIVAAYGKLTVFSATGQQVSDRTVPTGNISGEGLSYLTGGCAGILPWNNQHTAVIYQTIQKVNNSYKDDTYLYLINENTGGIDTQKQYYNIFYPENDIGYLGYSGRWDIYKFSIIPTRLNSNLIGIEAVYDINRSYNISTWRQYYSVIKKDLTVAYTSPRLDYQFGSGWTGTRYYGGWQLLNDKFAAFHEYEEYKDYYNYKNKYYTTCRIFNNNGDTVVYMPRNEQNSAGGLSNNYIYTTTENRTQMFSDNAQLLWQKPLSEANPVSQNLFMNLLVSSPLSLINPNNGSAVNIIPHDYLFNTKDYLVGYGKTSTGQRDGTLRGFSQLQGLQYLKQVIQNHTWDPDKCNVVVSVIDGDSYKDFEAQKDSVVSLLQAHNLKLAVISPSTGSTKSQAGEMIAKNAEGGWWIQTADDMSIPLSDLSEKIIKAEDRGADNIVLVGQEASLRANYQDPEDDPATMMTWSFTHDPERLGDYEPVEKADISVLHDTSKTIIPDGNHTTLDTVFDQAGTYRVYCKAQDHPNTTEAYREHEKAGNKWSNQDAYITIIAHYKPVASFTITDTTVNKNVPLSIIDNSYDPDLYNPASQETTDPLNQKGLRCWQWQCKKPDGTWESFIRYNNVPPAINTAAGTYQIRLRVQDVFEAWSDWTEAKPFNVVNRPPVAGFNALPNPVSINNSCSLIDYSYDPDGDPIINWDWTIQGVGEFNKINPNPFQVSWPNIGAYLVTLRVQDSEGAWSDPFSQTVKVINHMMLTLQSQAIGNGRGIAKASPGGNPPGPSGLNWVDHPVYPVTINSNVIGAYSPNQQVTLTAEPITSESYFVEWREGDNVISTNPTCTISMNKDRTITAVFKKDPIFIPAVPPKIHVYIVK